jgi:hypothetical protein
MVFSPKISRLPDEECATDATSFVISYPWLFAFVIDGAFALSICSLQQTDRIAD